MLSYDFFLDLAIILLATKMMGLLTRKIQMPQVVGALLAGVILGPAVPNVVHESDFINKMAELGVIVLMFSAGMETDIKEMKKCGKAAFVIAIAGVGVPLIGGFLVAAMFSEHPLISNMTQLELLKNIFIGVVLTATSVSITVETLREMGKPGPVGDANASKYNKDAEANYKGYLVAEFTYPILPPHEGGAMWFYSLPIHDSLCYPAEKLYKDYLDAIKYENIFSIDVGPNYEGKIREIDVKTLREVGALIGENNS